MPDNEFSITRQFMCPNLVFQQGISHHKNTLRPSMSISTFGTLHGSFAINHQWSIHFFIHRNGMKRICTTNILSPQFTAIQHNKWAWTASHPTPQWNCLPPFQPYHFTLRGILWFVRFHIFCGLVVALSGGGLDLESVESRKKRKWAKRLGRRWEKKSRLSECLTILWLRYYSLFFSLAKIAW